MVEVLVGGRYIIDGYPATVIAILGTREFDPAFKVEEWADVLATGIFVRDDQAGLIHYPDLETIHIEPLVE